MSSRILVALLVLLAPHGSRAQEQTKLQRRCLNTLHQSGVRVARAALADATACIRDATRGTLPAGMTASACLAADRRGAIALAQAKTVAFVARKCVELPNFGPRSADDVNLPLARPLRPELVFGEDLDAALTPGPGAGCQTATIRAMTRIARAQLAAFTRCARRGLARRSIVSSAGLEACAQPDDPSIARAIAAATGAVRRACGKADIATALPGLCRTATAATLGACLAPRVDCGVCECLNDAEGATRGCHEFRDGVATAFCGNPLVLDHSVAREWNERTLAAIRIDTPRPVVHARNLFHVSVAMWDAWAAYGNDRGYLVDETASASDVAAARDTAISFAAYRILTHRFAKSPGAATSLASFDTTFAGLGYDETFTDTTGATPAALGNRIAQTVIDHGLADGSNEAENHADPTYTPLNEPLVVKEPGAIMAEPNHWQPLALDVQIGQNGVPIPGKVQSFLGSHWGNVTPFALVRSAPGVPYADPGPPPILGGIGDAQFKANVLEVIRFSSQLTPDDPMMVDASPATRGNNTLGTNDGAGYPVNPITLAPYTPQMVKRGDLVRVIGMFWADGPASETPPGHWNVLANDVADHPGFEKRFMGTGPILDDLAWDVRTYFFINGALHDAAIACWEAKRIYDYPRPISMVRYMGGRGQSSDPLGAAYHPHGLPLEPGLVEVITVDSSQPGERHAHLADHVGEMAILAWPGQPENIDTQYSGVRWIRAVTFLPYQLKTFVTPPFAAYTSGHSTYSRAAAEVMTRLTGSPYFPEGLGEFTAEQDTFIPPERGPSTTVKLQWASYYDAADEAGISRLMSGIHVAADDFGGRIVGSGVGIAAFDHALEYLGDAP